MSKSNKKKKNQKAKNLQNNKPVVASEDLAQDVKAENVVEEARVEESKQKVNKKDKKVKKQDKTPKPNKVKESVAEIKKVTWPTFPQVVKNTLLVLGIVLIFTIVLFGIDFGLSQLYKLLTQSA